MRPDFLIVVLFLENDLHLNADFCIGKLTQGPDRF